MRYRSTLIAILSTTVVSLALADTPKVAVEELHKADGGL